VPAPTLALRTATVPPAAPGSTKTRHFISLSRPGAGWRFTPPGGSARGGKMRATCGPFYVGVRRKSAPLNQLISLRKARRDVNSRGNGAVSQVTTDESPLRFLAVLWRTWQNPG
jgi:hypothetical protein